MIAFDHSDVVARLLTLKALAERLYDQAAAWAIQLDWYHLRPVLFFDAGIVALSVLFLFQPARTDEEAQTFWSHVALAGRCMASVAGVTLAVFVTVNGTRAV